MHLSGTLSLKTNLSYGHILGAAILAGNCKGFERDYAWPATDPILAAHGSYAIGAVILAACSLESWANEYHHDIRDRNRASIGKAIDHVDKIQALWDTVERLPLLRKYQWFLQITDCETFDEGSPAFQAVGDLMELRDALVHYKPEWTHELKNNRRLENRLRAKFPLNALSKPDQLFIPYRCLGHGSGKWAVESVMAFASAFCERIGRKNLFVEYESRLTAFLAGAAT